jgi:hypothetical protein
VLNARDQIIAEGLRVLSNEELVILGVVSERVLRARLKSLEHALIGFAASAATMIVTIARRCGAAPARTRRRVGLSSASRPTVGQLRAIRHR